MKESIFTNSEFLPTDTQIMDIQHEISKLKEQIKLFFQKLNKKK
jgi:hypothetical protein